MKMAILLLGLVVLASGCTQTEPAQAPLADSGNATAPTVPDDGLDQALQDLDATFADATTAAG